MTVSDFINAGIAIDDTPTALLYAESAIDWIEQNTTLVVDRTNLSALPAGAKLFILRYGDVMRTDTTVTSESLGGMSQSFSTETRNSLLLDLAYDLLGAYIKSQVTFTAAQIRWKYR